MIIGVDPGLDGAICRLGRDGNVWIADMPTFRLKRGKAQRRELDLVGLCNILRSSIEDHDGARAFVELAQAMPRQGTASMFSFGRSYGATLGILAALQIPVSIVSPAKWKRSLGVPAGKDAARARASALMPQAAHQWPLKKHDGRAEATLIALYGQRSLQGAP